MTASAFIFDQLCQLLDDTGTGWSLGTFGAIAEFNRHEQEDASLARQANTAEVVTSLGAIRILDNTYARLLPYESLSKLKNAWSQGIVICLPASDATMAGNTVITDLGTDEDAITPAGGSRFFDLGLAVPHVDFCVRTNDPTLIHVLQKHTGTALLTAGDSVSSAIRAAGAVRVFRSRLGRIEVYQDIPPDSPASHTPTGPHTHLIMDLLARGRTHAANIPVANGWLPCLAAYPPNPIRAGNGDLKSFDHETFRRFQSLITTFSSPEVATIKRQVFDAIDGGKLPDSLRPPTTRMERTALRVALRQCHHLHGSSDILDRWKAVYEPTGRQ